MTKKKFQREKDSRKKVTLSRESITIPATEVGITLKVSNDALEQMDRLEREKTKAALQSQKMSWRHNLIES